MSAKSLGQLELFNPFDEHHPASLKVMNNGTVVVEVPEPCAREIWQIASAARIDYVEFIHRLVNFLVEEIEEDQQSGKRNVIEFSSPEAKT